MPLFRHARSKRAIVAADPVYVCGKKILFLAQQTPCSASVHGDDKDPSYMIEVIYQMKSSSRDHASWSAFNMRLVSALLKKDIPIGTARG
jgi:hypothetical protein